MKHLDLTFPTPQQNLACDETLLEACEVGQGDEVLRTWESVTHFAVLGYANKAACEVNLQKSEELGIPVLRRTSGGGAVVQGPGCLSYSLILKADSTGVTVTETNKLVMERLQSAFKTHFSLPVEIQGITDLVLNGRKFSGNAQRRLKNSVLFHGTILLSFDIDIVSQVLTYPSWAPDYRQTRPHGDFITNLPAEVNRAKVISALRQTWNAQETANPPPLAEIDALVAAKYSRAEWNLKF